MQLSISGKMVLIDDEDWPVVSKYNWVIKKDKKSFYVTTSVWINNKKHKLYLHRLLMGMKQSHTDHINRNPLDNRKINLRPCVNMQNCFNRKRYNKYGFKGVNKNPGGYFYARVQVGKDRFLDGPFKTAKEAAIAYNILVKKHHGDFAIYNTIGE